MSNSPPASRLPHAGPVHERPTRQQLQAALHKRVPDLIGPGLDILFCGINPGLYSAATGHHFAGPSNRFWLVLHAAGFTPRRFSPFEERELLKLGLGITNFVARASASASDLSQDELIAGARVVRRKVMRFRPKVLAVVGLGAYRIAFSSPRSEPGLQDELIGSARVWLLPNPSGLNAHHQVPALVEMFRELRSFAAALDTAVR